MAFFKSDKERLKEAKSKILISKEFEGKVGQIHQGLSEFGLWGVLDNGKTKFNPSKFKLYDDKIMIERNRTFLNLSDIKEIFQEKEKEALIILKTGEVIPIQAKNYHSWDIINFKAFLNILNNLIKDNNSESNNIESPKDNNLQSEDKFDKLIKLGEMHDKGLLSDEEFASLKQELLAGNTEDTTSDIDEETSDTTCDNCGAEVSSDDAFCSECGAQIN